MCLKFYSKFIIELVMIIYQNFILMYINDVKNYEYKILLLLGNYYIKIHIYIYMYIYIYIYMFVCVCLEAKLASFRFPNKNNKQL